MANSSSFTMNVAHTQSLETHPSNCESSFWVWFPSEVSLNSSYEVALQSIVVPMDACLDVNHESEREKLINNHIMIYCSIVKKSIVGNALAQLLDTAPCAELALFSQDKAAFYTVPYLTWHSIETSKFHKMKFYVTTVTGEEVKFKPLREPIVYNLSFRMRKM